MVNPAPVKPQTSPRPSTLAFEGREYPMLWEASGWRLRSKAKSHPADYRTGSTNLKLAQQRAKEWLKKRGDDPIISRKGGGTLEALAKLYNATPKKTKDKVGKNNVSRMRAICRLALGKELDAVTCRQVGPDLWLAFQKAAMERAGHKFDLVTRRRENIGINAAIRAAATLFLPALRRVYSAAGLDVNQDAGQWTPLPVPYVAPAPLDDAELQKQWEALAKTDTRLWLVIGLARFGGMRREEMNAARGSWVEEKNGVVSVYLCDRPEENWWTKTGKPYRAQIIHPDLAGHLRVARENPDALIVPDPPSGDGRDKWFERIPQQWLHARGLAAPKPLHRLRGLYADHILKLTEDAVAARLAGVRAAQENLGHTTSATTEKHYLSTP